MWACSSLAIFAAGQSADIDLGAIIRDSGWVTVVVLCLGAAVFVTALGFAAYHILSLQVSFYSDAAEALRRIARRPRRRGRR